MLAADLARIVLMAALAVLAYAGGSYAVSFVLAVVSTMISSVFIPAQAALIPTLVETPEELTAQNAVMNTVASAGMFAGPALAGALLAVSGPGAVFVLTAATFAWSALCLLGVPRDAPPTEHEQAEHGHAAAGFHAIAGSSRLRLIVGLTSAQALACGLLEVLLVVVALQVVAGGSSAVGWLNTGMGVGCVAGVVVIAGLAGRKRLAGDLAVGILLFGVPFAAAALSHRLAVAVVLFAVIGAGNTVFDVSSMTLMQRSADEAVLARVFGVLESLSLAALAAGALLAPVLVSWLGARTAVLVAGAFLPVLLVLTWPSLRRVDAEARVPTAALELLGRLPLFAPLPPTVLERLASAAAPVHVPAMTEAVSQGAVGDRFFVIRSGRATVEIDGAETGELGPGEFFGEIALLRDVPRTATVRALEPLELFALERDDFLAAVTGHAPSRAAADSIVAQRLPAGAAG
jgi:MFS family permease